MFSFISNLADFLNICAKKSENTEFKSVTLESIQMAAQSSGLSAEEYLRQPGVKPSLMKHLSKDAEEVSRITGEIFQEWEMVRELRKSETARAEAEALLLAKASAETESTPEAIEETKIESFITKATRWFAVIASVISSAASIYKAFKNLSSNVVVVPQVVPAA